MTDPDWSSPPGDTIVRLMARKEIDASDLADALSISSSQFGDLITGARRLTEADAVILSANLGSTPRFWLARDAAYVLDVARLQNDGSESGEAKWLESMPASSMRKFGWVTKGIRAKDRLRDEILEFFDCSSLQEWGKRYSTGVGAVAFRTSVSLESDGMATLVWLRAGEIAVAGRERPRFDANAFQRLLPHLKKLSAFKRPSVFLSRLVEACHAVGVAVATARSPEGCRASGASWFDQHGNPVILLSFRHLAEDHFWFTFFHEAAHVLLHGTNHIDGDGNRVMGGDTERQEREANDFAQEVLFPSEVRAKFADRGYRTQAVRDIARAADVTPGIIVGQLEKSGAVRHGSLNHLRHRYRWGDNPYVPELVDYPRK